jgi:hypothetical protein
MSSAAAPAGEGARAGRAGRGRFAVAWSYLLCFIAVEIIYVLLRPGAQAAFVSWASTSVVNLEHDPVGCLVGISLRHGQRCGRHTAVGCR